MNWRLSMLYRNSPKSVEFGARYAYTSRVPAITLRFWLGSCCSDFSCLFCDLHTVVCLLVSFIDLVLSVYCRLLRFYVSFVSFTSHFFISIKQQNTFKYQCRETNISKKNNSSSYCLSCILLIFYVLCKVDISKTEWS